MINPIFIITQRSVLLLVLGLCVSVFAGAEETGEALSKEWVREVQKRLWQAYREDSVGQKLATLLPSPLIVKSDEPFHPQAGRLTLGEKIMPFYFFGKGDLAGKRPLFIALHGGGSAGGKAASPHGWSVNTREWETQKHLAKKIYPADALYFVPRMADDNDGRWYYSYCQDAYDQVIRAAILHHNVDPNRVYLIGISEGAYTAYRMGSFMADRWAGAVSMAGGEPSKNAPPENMRNLAFRADVGENDTMFDRVGLNRQYGQALEKLKKEDPEGYLHQINVRAGRGHGIDYKSGPEWVFQHRRNPWPSRVVWKVIEVHGRRKRQFYWLALDNAPASLPLIIDAQIDAKNNTVNVTMETEGKDGTRTPVQDVALRIYLNDHLVDLDQPVRMLLNGREQYKGLVSRRVETMKASLAERGDPSYIFPAQVQLNVPSQNQAGMDFLLAHMPQHDRGVLDEAMLVENVDLSYQAWRQAPWHDRIPEQLFLQYILPYSNLNERRDNWRKTFMDRLQEKAWSFDSPMDATIWINTELNDIFHVYYHASKRPKPDQSPNESIDAGYASCTGLSILLADACRSIGIPARIVGVPYWLKESGNHNWVEIWDGQWHNVGGTGSDPRDDDWVNKRCLEQTDPDQWQHSVYAACFRKTPLHFPLVWNFEIDYVNALNVTRFYSNPQTVKIDIPNGGKGVVEVYWAGEIIVRLPGEKQISCTLAGGSAYQIQITTPDGQVHKKTLRL